MGKVARFTTVYHHGGMLVKKGAAFIGVALETCFLILEAGIDQVRTPSHLPCWSACAVRVMTIGAHHHALVYAMLGGLRKLGTDIAMASVTDFSLSLRQQASVRLRAMNRMTGCADYISFAVIATANIRPVQIFTVATEAGVENLIWR